MKKLENDIKILGLPFAILATLIIITIIVAQILLNNITKLNSEVSDNTKAQNMLQIKLNSLQSVTPEVGSESNAVILALPVSNSALNAIIELKNIALNEGLIITKLSSNNPWLLPGASVNSSVINFEMDGKYEDLSKFIVDAKSIAPIVRFDTIKITNQASGVYHLTASIFSYWSPLPVTLPAIDEPIVKLTSDEETILQNVSALKSIPPVSLSNNSSASAIGRANPFTQ